MSFISEIRHKNQSNQFNEFYNQIESHISSSMQQTNEMKEMDNKLFQA